MRRTALLLAGSLAALLAAAPALAEDAPAPGARFAFVPAEGGALKMDTTTGKVSFCSKGPSGFSCEAVADSRDAYEAEIARLQAEVETLKSSRAAGGEAAGTATPGTPGAAPKEPDFTDLDHALDYVERVFRRLKAMVEGLNSNPPPGEKL